MKLLLDMNLPPRWAAPLGEAGHGAVHWRDIGPRGAPDREILEHARLHRQVVPTHDLDFGDILVATSGTAPSVVLIRADGLGWSEVGPRLPGLLRDHADALDAGALATLDLQRMRIRLLPLARGD